MGRDGTGYTCLLILSARRIHTDIDYASQQYRDELIFAGQARLCFRRVIPASSIAINNPCVYDTKSLSLGLIRGGGLVS